MLSHNQSNEERREDINLFQIIGLDCLQLIFSFLTMKDYFAFKSTCHFINNITAFQLIYKTVRYVNINFTAIDWNSIAELLTKGLEEQRTRGDYNDLFVAENKAITHLERRYEQYRKNNPDCKFGIVNLSIFKESITLDHPVKFVSKITKNDIVSMSVLHPYTPTQFYNPTATYSKDKATAYIQHSKPKITAP